MGAKFDRYAPQMIADLVHDFNITPVQASGFPGNGGGESRGFEDIIEDGAIAKGWAGGTGWMQWTGMTPGDRRYEFEKWLRRKGFRADSYEGNYSFLFRELKGAEGARVLPKLRQATTVEEATRIVCYEFERPNKQAAAKSMPVRVNYAKRALQLYSANPPSPTVWATDTEVQPMPTFPNAQVNVPVPKSQFQSSTVLGAILAIVSPIIGPLVPGLAPVLGMAQNPEFMQAVGTVIATAGPVLGGITAWLGRLKVTQPIAGTAAAEVVRKRYEAALNTPAPEQYVPSESWRDEPAPVREAPPVYDLDQVPFATIVEWLPRIRQMLTALDAASQPRLPGPQP